MTRHTVTIQQAVTLTGLSIRTIQRRLKAGKYPGAYKSSDNVWQIPTADLAEQTASKPPDRAPDRAAALLAARQEYIEHLRQQVEQQTHEIERLHARLEDMQRLLDQQQRLALMQSSSTPGLWQRVRGYFSEKTE